MEIDEIYQEIILDHSRRPRNNKEIVPADVVMSGNNPLCGDEIKITAKLNSDIIEKIGFTGSGCAISQASASLLTEKISGKSKEEFEQMFKEFSALLKKEAESLDSKKFGNLLALKGVSAFPARIKCALLAWHTLSKGLELGKSGTDKTTQI